MPASDRRYCAVSLFFARRPDVPGILSVSADIGRPRVVLFSTLAEAQSVIPRLGSGRIEHWSADQETIFWSPLNPFGFNKAQIWKGYDPYNVPANLLPGVRSESPFLDWHSHVLYVQILDALLEWCDGLEEQRQQHADIGQLSAGSVLSRRA